MGDQLASRIDWRGTGALLESNQTSAHAPPDSGGQAEEERCTGTGAVQALLMLEGAGGC